MEKYKSYILPLSLAVTASVLIYFAGAIILPFLIGIFGASLANSIVVKIQKKVPNRNLSVTLFLLGAVVLLLGSGWLFGSQLVNDSRRLNNAFVTFLDDNNQEIDETSKTIKSYIEKIYPSKKTNNGIDYDFNLDSLRLNSVKRSALNIDSLNIDSNKLSESLSSITSFFTSNDEEKANTSTLSWFLTLLYSTGYFIYTLYTFTYFEDRFNKYFGAEKKSNSQLDSIIHDFQNTIIKYFRQRSIIVLICSAIFISAFSIIGIPGAIILGLLAGTLCYIAHFHYVILLPAALSCWVLSIEQSHSFFLYFGLIVAVLALVSAFEEFVFFPKIMTGVASMNPAIMLVSLSFWSFLFGTIGLFIALPLTTLVLLYADRLLLDRKKQLEG
jgi:predicted PurR-regulated permease PerM